ncbi:TPA: hypothetical protein DF272_00755 [Candidatus Falkowbacteria bacterium]|nr:hypothetical protein [Candidatus Falkowbacteria bacterium]
MIETISANEETRIKYRKQVMENIDNIDLFRRLKMNRKQIKLFVDGFAAVAWVKSVLIENNIRLDEKEEFNLGVWIGQFHNKNGRCWDAAEDIVNRTLNSTEHKLTRPSIDP